MLFGVGFGEVLVIVLVLLLVVGPRRLPALAQKAGRSLRAIKKTAHAFQSALQLEELQDLEHQLQDPWQPTPPNAQTQVISEIAPEATLNQGVTPKETLDVAQEEALPVAENPQSGPQTGDPPAENQQSGPQTGDPPAENQQSGPQTEVFPAENPQSALQTGDLPPENPHFTPKTALLPQEPPASAMNNAGIPQGSVEGDRDAG